MCFGVRDAIALAVRQAATEPLTVLGDLVHNETVLAELRARGVKIAQQVAAVETRTVMITAHGASEKAIGAGARAGAERDGGDLSAGASGASRGGETRARWLSPGHRGQARPCRGARPDGRPGRTSMSCFRRRMCWS